MQREGFSMCARDMHLAFRAPQRAEADRAEAGHAAEGGGKLLRRKRSGNLNLNRQSVPPRFLTHRSHPVVPTTLLVPGLATLPAGSPVT